MKGKFLLALAAGAMSAAFAQQATAQPECTIGTTDYVAIQDAVDDENCRTIIVPAGTYMENVIIDRDVTIRGAGPQRTKVDAGGAYVSVFNIRGLNLAPSGTPCIVPGVVVNLEGMTITGGKGPPSDSAQRNGGGIQTSPGVDLVVKNCIVTGNSALQYGGGISVANGRLTVIDSVISFNTAYVTTTPPADYFGGGGGIRVTGCPSYLAIMDSVIEGNRSYAFGGGILSTVFPSNAVTYGQGRLILKDVDIKRNAADESGGGVFYDGIVFTTSDAKVKHNVPNDVQDGPPAP
jgi:hypothetical protein